MAEPTPGTHGWRGWRGWLGRFAWRRWFGELRQRGWFSRRGWRDWFREPGHLATPLGAALAVFGLVALTLVFDAPYLEPHCGDRGYPPCPPHAYVYVWLIFPAMVGLVAGLVVLVHGLTMLWTGEPLLDWPQVKSIGEKGRPARVTVRELRHLPLPIVKDADGFEFQPIGAFQRLRMWVEPGDGTPPYETNVSMLVPWWSPLEVGQQYPAGIYRRDPRKVAPKFPPRPRP